MLNRIFIKDYILIDQLDLELSKGLNILTGETGAGKSILINAIDIAFGAKCGKEVIRAGAQKAVIEITLINNKQEISSIFQEYGVDEYEEEIVVSREITQTGSRSRVNGCLVNQEFIKFVREKFIDIHSQHQTYSFLQTKYHIALLDSYIKSSILSSYKKEFEDTKTCWKTFPIATNTFALTSFKTQIRRSTKFSRCCPLVTKTFSWWVTTTNLFIVGVVQTLAICSNLNKISPIQRSFIWNKTIVVQRKFWKLPTKLFLAILNVTKRNCLLKIKMAKRCKLFPPSTNKTKPITSYNK